MKKKSLAIVLALLIALALFPIEAMAADQITVSFYVFNPNTGLKEKIGTEMVNKVSNQIQSEPYKIQPISYFTASNYGQVTEVRGNWYGYYTSCNVGATVYFSNNSSTATVTYWVTGGGTGTTPGDPGSGVVDLGGGGSYTINFSVVYHSNYPDGTDYSITKKYTVKNYVAMYTFWLHPTPADCGFSYPGYSSRTAPWSAQADGSGGSTISASNNGSYNMYAQWVTNTPTYYEYNLYFDGNTTDAVGNMPADQNAVTQTNSHAFTIGGEVPARSGYSFEGWAETADGSVAYQAGDDITLTYPDVNQTLYAVWEEDNDPPDPAAITSVVADNDTGKLTITLYPIPASTPTPDEFDITWDGGLNPNDDDQELTNFTYDPELGTVTYDFTPYAPASVDQYVTFHVLFNDVSTDSNVIFIPAVPDEPEDIEIIYPNAGTVSVQKNQKVTLEIQTNPVITDWSQYTVAWTSMDKTIASVNSSGVVTGKNVGMTIITVTITHIATNKTASLDFYVMVY